MSVVFYGGDPITGGGSIALVRCQLLQWQRRPIYHGTDYVMTRHALRFRGVLNRDLNAYDFGNPAGLPPRSLINPTGLAAQSVTRGAFTGDTAALLNRLATQAAFPNLGVNSVSSGPRLNRGSDAPLTDAAIRHKLSQPKRLFAWFPIAGPPFVSPNGVVTQENGSKDCDVKGGPFPLVHDVIQIVGTKSYIVDFEIETYVNETDLFNVTPSTLLSNRWTEEEDIDQDFFAIRKISGLAMFRKDRLIDLGAFADDFRAYCFPPLANGFHRFAIHVAISEDDTQLAYTVIDRQTAMTVVPEVVSRIEAWQDVKASNLSLEGVAVALGEIFIDIIEKGQSRILASPIPMTTSTVAARIWGYPAATRKALENVGINLVLARFGFAFNVVGNWSGATAISVTHDLSGKFVEAKATKMTAINSAPYRGVVTAANIPNVGGSFPAFDQTDATGNILAVTGPGKGPPVDRVSNGTSGTRGTYMKALAGQILQSTDGQIPPRIPVTRNFVSRTPP